jgi:thioredoxin 1
MAYVKNVDDRAFADIIATGTVLVDFSADWCGPCRMLAPILELLAQQMKDSLVVIKVDVDESQSIAMQYDISSVPTLILFKDGAVKQKIVGLKDLASLKRLIQDSNHE